MVASESSPVSAPALETSGAVVDAGGVVTEPVIAPEPSTVLPPAAQTAQVHYEGSSKPPPEQAPPPPPPLAEERRFLARPSQMSSATCLESRTPMSLAFQALDQGRHRASRSRETSSREGEPGSSDVVAATTTTVPAVDDSEAHPQVARLTLPDGQEIELNILQETVSNARAILDVRSLYSNYRVLTYDPGFNSTCSCASAITYIDGDKGICTYRGYPVHELTANNDFLDVCFLLLYGELPSTAAKKMFERQIKDEMLLHNRLREFIQTFVPGAHPMSILASVISAFASFYADPMSVDHINCFEMRELACIRLIAKMPTVIAMAYKTLIGEPLVYPRADLSFSENILHMMFSKPIEPYRVNPLHAKIIDTFLIIHADHEQNASTSTVRTAGSSLANPYACIATGITSLWGRAHGGANEAVVRMLNDIGCVENIPEFVAKVKNKEVRLMGFGHRIYRNYDPRAKLMRDLCYELRNTPTDGKRLDGLFDLALELEKVALSDDYFTSRKLYPNVDFYSGVVMRALNIPVEMFTTMFALGRCVGWLAHWKEMVLEGQLKIARPRQLYLGETLRHIQREIPIKMNSAEHTKYSNESMWDIYEKMETHDAFHRIQAAITRERACSAALGLH